MNRFTKAITQSGLALALMGTALLTACSSGGNGDCQAQLDNQEYQSVVDNADCPDYMRASAYLGLAGFNFATFFANMDSQDYRTALNIPADVADWASWEGKTHYESALQLTGIGAGDAYEGLTRPNEVTEVHFFGLVGKSLAETAINFDTDADGVMSQAEINAFTKVNDPTAGDFGQNSIIGSSYLQFVSGGTTYLFDLANGFCELDATSAGEWTGTGTDLTTTCGVGVLAALAAGGECNLVVQIDDVQKMFTEVIPTSSNVTTFTEGFISNADLMSVDIGELVPASDGTSTFDTAKDSFTALLDNGGTCTSTTIDEVGQLMTLIGSAQATSLADYSAINLLPLADLQGSSDTTVTAPPTSVGGNSINCNNLNARLLFLHPDGLYYPYFDPCNGVAGCGQRSLSNIYTTFQSLTNIQLDGQGNPKPTVAGDGLVSFQELLCMTGG